MDAKPSDRVVAAAVAAFRTVLPARLRCAAPVRRRRSA